MPKIVSIILLLLLCSCAANIQLVPDDVENKDIIIFMPGYRGSKLVDASDGSTVWLSFGQLLFGHESLDFNSEDKLLADGVLKEVEVVPHIYGIDIYKQCLSSLEKLGDYKIVEFGYDWRNSNTVTASKFRELVQKLHKKGAKSVSVIAHSMGGLSLAYALGFDDTLNLDKVVFMGTLFRGTLIGFLDMNRHLKPVPIDKDFYTRKEYASFKSAFEFMPHPSDKSFTDLDLTNSETIYNIDYWKKYNWGILKGNENPNYERLEKDLDTARNYYDSQEFISATCPNTKILNIRGQGKPVVTKYKFSDIENGNFKKKESYSKEDGDGLVTLVSSQLPKSLQTCQNTDVILEKIKHNRMCNDKRVKSVLREFFKK